MTPARPARPRPVTMGGAAPKRAAPAADRAPRVAIDRSGFSGAVLFVVSNMSYIAATTLVVAHLLFAVEEHSFAVRFLTAIPGVIFFLEGRKFLKDEPGELPFIVLALAQYYAVFSLGVFFEIKFFDFRGLVVFTPDARLSAAAAVALGAVCVWLGARVGRHFGRDFQPWATKILPPARVPEQWDQATIGYGLACMAMALLVLFVPGVVPPSIDLPVAYAFAIELAMGFVLVIPPKRFGVRAAQILLAFLVGFSLLKGTLDAIFRGGIAYMAGRWAAARTVSLRIAAAVIVLYVVLQPAKASYRQQVWGQAARSGRMLGVSDRVDAWQGAFSDYFSDRGGSSSSDDSASMGRLSELGATMHAFQVLPGRVEFLDGKGLLPIVYSPVPRFIWPNKPTTRDHVQRYGIIFGRQSEEGARTTALNLPLLVEGYWNFGWPGIVLVTAALGFWVGLSQKVFASEHWALRAIGIANITSLTVAGSLVYVYGALFQTVVARTAVCWALFGVATALSKKRYDGAPKLVGVTGLSARARAGPRAIARRATK